MQTKRDRGASADPAMSTIWAVVFFVLFILALTGGYEQGQYQEPLHTDSFWAWLWGGLCLYHGIRAVLGR